MDQKYQNDMVHYLLSQHQKYFLLSHFIDYVTFGLHEQMRSLLKNLMKCALCEKDYLWVSFFLMDMNSNFHFSVSFLKYLCSYADVCLYFNVFEVPSHKLKTFCVLT